MRRQALTAALTAALAGCALTPPPNHGDVVVKALPQGTRIPPAWVAEPAGGEVANDWVKSFNDPALEAIVAEAIANNLDLRQAADRVAIAQQSIIVVGAQLLPQVGVVAGGRATRDQDHSGTSTVTRAFAEVSWEIDVWGKLRAEHAAAVAGYEAAALDYAYARQSLAATAARTWCVTIEARQLLELTEESVEIYRQLLDLVTIRRSAGKDTDLDVADTRAKLDTSMSDVDAARASYGEARRALEVLLGRYPAAEIEVAANYPALPAPALPGVPASMLERRPDVLAAERSVLATFRQQEAAKLALLPDLSISFVGGHLDDPVLSVLRLNPWLASSAIGVSIPIYEGGALQAKVAIATAQQSQAVAHYGSVMLGAFREVENAFADEQLLTDRLPLDRSAVEARSEAVRIATIQYKAGRRDLLWVSNLQTNQITNQADLIKLQALQRVNRIRLYLALGASFDVLPAASVRQGQ